MGKLQFMGKQRFAEKKKNKCLITLEGAGEEGSWIPRLGGSLGSQLFQVELNLVDQHPLRNISVCQTLHPIPSSVPLSQQHTHSHSSVQTHLCSSQWENLSESTNHSSGYIGPSVHRKQRNRYTYADVTKERHLFVIFHYSPKKFLLLRSNLNNTGTPPPTPAPKCYIFQSRSTT